MSCRIFLLSYQVYNDDRERDGRRYGNREEGKRERARARKNRRLKKIFGERNIQVSPSLSLFFLFLTLIVLLATICPYLPCVKHQLLVDIDQVDVFYSSIGMKKSDQRIKHQYRCFCSNNSSCQRRKKKRFS